MAFAVNTSDEAVGRMNGHSTVDYHGHNHGCLLSSQYFTAKELEHNRSSERMLLTKTASSEEISEIMKYDGKLESFLNFTELLTSSVKIHEHSSTIAVNYAT